MGDIPVDGMTRVAYIPAIALISSPTVAELNAGILLQTLITADGLLGFEADTNDVPSTSLASKFDTNDVGRTKYQNLGVRLKKQSSGDTAYTTLVKNTAGFIAIRRDIDQAIAWAAVQEVEIYPIKCGETKRLMPEADTMTRYEVPFKLTDEPELRAVVAA